MTQHFQWLAGAFPYRPMKSRLDDVVWCPVALFLRWLTGGFPNYTEEGLFVCLWARLIPPVFEKLYTAAVGHIALAHSSRRWPGGLGRSLSELHEWQERGVGMGKEGKGR